MKVLPLTLLLVCATAGSAAGQTGAAPAAAAGDSVARDSVARGEVAGRPVARDPLEFAGFRAGAHLTDVSDRLLETDGGRLRCDRSRKDRRVTECRAQLSDPDLGGAAELWVSAIDSVAGVMTVSATVEADRLDRWRAELERRYGRVGARVQGAQWMMQWVRQGRMIRLTWRTEQGNRVASVSLVDGRTLDAWSAPRAARNKGA